MGSGRFLVNCLQVDAQQAFKSAKVFSLSKSRPIIVIDQVTQRQIQYYNEHSILKTYYVSDTLANLAEMFDAGEVVNTSYTLSGSVVNCLIMGRNVFDAIDNNAVTANTTAVTYNMGSPDIRSYILNISFANFNAQMDAAEGGSLDTATATQGLVENDKFTFPSLAGVTGGDFGTFYYTSSLYAAVWLDKNGDGTTDLPSGTIFTAATIKIRANISANTTAIQNAATVKAALIANSTINADDTIVDNLDGSLNVINKNGGVVGGAPNVHNKAEGGAGSITFSRVQAGTALSQTTAYPIFAELTNFTVSPVLSGAILPQGPINGTRTVKIINNGANSISLYPPVGGKIGAGSTNAPVTITAGITVLKYVSTSDIQYYVS